MKRWLVILLFGLWLPHIQAEPKNAPKPNIILILAESLAWSDLGAFGSELPTPNLDSLAMSGTRFNHFYHSGSPQQSLQALLKGQEKRNSPLDTTSQLVSKLGQSGYSSHFSGKWSYSHSLNHHPGKIGFNGHFAAVGDKIHYSAPNNMLPDAKKRPVILSDGTPISLFPDSFHLTQWIGNYSAAVIKKQTSDNQKPPFFLTVSFNAPSPPLILENGSDTSSTSHYLAGWNNMRQQRFQNLRKLNLVTRTTRLLPDLKLQKAWQQTPHKEWESKRMAVRSEMIRGLDKAVGTIITALKNANQFNNTIILFASLSAPTSVPSPHDAPEFTPGDASHSMSVGPNWTTASLTPFSSSTPLSEGNISSPFFISWPGKISPGGIHSQIAHLRDIPTTLLATTDQEANQPPVFESINLLAPDRGKEDKPRQPICWEKDGFRAIRNDDWKAVFSPINKKWALYDIKRDRTESVDVSSRNSKILKVLEANWLEWSVAAGIK